MKLFVGLGNPGKKYEKTRHNVGWMVLEALASKITNFQLPISNQIPNSNFQFQKQYNADILKVGNIILAKPQTFMNDSGVAVSSLATFYKLPATNIYIIHDDLDIKLGDYKIQKGKGPKVHNGVNSVEEELGKKDFWRVRVGIENRGNSANITNIANDGKGRISGEVYTLQDFEEEELETLDEVIEEVISKLHLL